MKQKKVTFADIAAYTGFSKTTISRYFNNPDSLTLENQEKSLMHWICWNYHPQPTSSLLL